MFSSLHSRPSARTRQMLIYLRVSASDELVVFLALAFVVLVKIVLLAGSRSGVSAARIPTSYRGSLTTEVTAIESRTILTSGASPEPKSGLLIFSCAKGLTMAHRPEEDGPQPVQMVIHLNVILAAITAIIVLGTCICTCL